MSALYAAFCDLAAARDERDRANDLRIALDTIRRACRQRGLSAAELLQFLQTLHANTRPNQGIDMQLEALLDVCIELEDEPEVEEDDVRELAQFDKQIDRVTA